MNREQILNFLAEHKHELERNFGVTRIGLFGSFARGEASEDSDIDIAIELKKEGIADNYFGLLHYLEDNLHRKIDLGIESNLKPVIKKYVEEEIIYV